MNNKIAKIARAGAAAIGAVAVSLGVAGLVQSVLPLLDRLGLLLVGSVLLVGVGIALVGIGLLPAAKGLVHSKRSIFVYLSSINSLLTHLEFLRALFEDWARPVFLEEKCRDPKGLSAHEHKGFSRHGEDGIVAEIFRRIGTTNRYFVEFGASDGTESNTLLWLCAGWSGLWMEGDPDAVARAQQRFRSYIAAGKLTIRQALIDAENVEGLFREAGVPEEFDLLSLDIDYNDYYVWEAIQSFRPRVVEIEYNAIWPPDVEWVVPYDPKAMWDHTARFGASLKSFEKLGRQKGYSLVGCAFRGGNAFFVRDDLLGDHFSAPYTAERHYEPWHGWPNRRIV
jgi:hypothetical protein